MKKLILFLSTACLLFVTPSCSKKDARNIVIGQDYLMVAMEYIQGKTDLITLLFDKAPGVVFNMKEAQVGTISDGTKTYTFGWKYVNASCTAIEIEFQKPEQYGSVEVKDILINMSGIYHTDRTNGVRISENEGIDMDNKIVQMRMAAK